MNGYERVRNGCGILASCLTVRRGVVSEELAPCMGDESLDFSSDAMAEYRVLFFSCFSMLAGRFFLGSFISPEGNIFIVSGLPLLGLTSTRVARSVWVPSAAVPPRHGGALSGL